MSRQKVKLASGLTVRDGDTLIVTFTGKYVADDDCVVAANGERVWFDLASAAEDYPDQVTVAKIKPRTKGD